MISRSTDGRAQRRRPLVRVLAAVLALALGAAACGSADQEPTLTAERPPPPTSAAPDAPPVAPPAPTPNEPDAPALETGDTPTTTTAVPLGQTTEPTVAVTTAQQAAPTEPGATTTTLPDVPLPDEMENPDLTRLPADQAPAPAPPLELPAATPTWQPTTVMVAKDDVNGIIPVYDTPGGARLAFPDGDLWSYTFRGNRSVLRLVQGAPGDEWVQAELPVRPNGTRGWVRADNFNFSTVNHHIVIDVSEASVLFYEGDNLITSTKAIVGKPATPTPTLKGFLVEKLPNHGQQNGSVVLGDWILMLSFFSEALNSFGGGLPRIALHGTHIPERVGEELSNGCIRIPNDIVEAIAQQAPLGTVVNIVA